jgi:murein L,D-transpeptidase YafK
MFLFSGCNNAYSPVDHGSVDYDKRFFNKPDHYETVEIIIYKEERELELYADSNCIGLFKCVLGSTPIGEKNNKGDGKTPEGEYYICTSHNKTNFEFFLGISYPNTVDAQRGLDTGKIDQNTFDTIKAAIDQKKQPPWDTPLGGSIGIHGGGNGRDWTAGCIALSSEDINIIKKYTSLRTPVTIYESRFTNPEKM